MKTDSKLPMSAPFQGQSSWQRFLRLPSTKLGRWSAILMAIFIVMFIVNSLVFMPSSSDAPWRHVILPFYGIAMLLCGLAAGVLGLITILRQHERSWFIWLSLLPGLFVVFLVVGEVVVPH